MKIQQRLSITYVPEIIEVMKQRRYRKKNSIRILISFFFLFLFLAGLSPPPVLEKDTFPWWKKTVHSQAKCHRSFALELVTLFFTPST